MRTPGMIGNCALRANKLLVLLCYFVAIALSGLSIAEEPKTAVPKWEFKDGDGIVFFGDSITHQCLYTQYIEDYFYTRFPNTHLRFFNAGVSGSVAWEALERFDGDVAAYKPKYVTLMLGMNDGEHVPFDQKIFTTYRKDMSTILNSIQKIGATPIVLTPTMFDARMRRKNRPSADAESTALYNAVLGYYGAWLREEASEKGFGFVDTWGPLNNITQEQRKTDPSFTMIPDAVHPAPTGHVVMAAAIINDLGLPKRVSSIRVSLAANKSPAINAFGGKLSDLKVHDDGLEFNWQADCLPWVLPENAQLGVRLTQLGHRLSQESVEIHGLSPGKYSLLIDGEVVGTFDNMQFERHVELQANSKTPQHQQALTVASRNQQRNEGPVTAVREEWWNFQDFVDARRESEASPADSNLKDKLAALEKKISGMTARVAENNAKAKLIEDEIYRLNKPPQRKYLIVRSSIKAR